MIRRTRLFAANTIRRTRLAYKAGRAALDPSWTALHGEHEGRKTRWQMALDNARWAFDRGELNPFYFAYGLDRVDGPSPDRFLSSPEMMRIVNRQIAEEGSRAYVGVLRDKFLFSLVARALGHPSPRLLAFLHPEGVEWLDPRREESFDALVRRAEALDGFVKPVGGDGGTGAFALAIRDGRAFIDGAEADPAAIGRTLRGRSVLQERVRQHADLARLYPTSLNTMRLVTALRGGDAAPLGAALRVGAGGDHADNWSLGGLIVRVDLDTGVLRGPGLFKPGRPGEARYGSTVSEHPDTGARLDGLRLPDIEAAIALACRFHRDLGHPRSVGWDLAFSEDGPVVIEGNSHWGGQIMMAFDPTFKARYLAAIGE